MTFTEKFLTLGTDYEGQNPLDWFVTKKLDGCRGYWDGNRLWTRQGRAVDAPAWFTAGLPADVRLDGEIYAGRGNIQAARCATQYGRDHFLRRNIRFMVFDCPDANGDYQTRMNEATRAVRGCRYASPVVVSVITERRELFARLQAVQGHGGEGVMLRNPTVTRYETGRTGNLLKVKAAHPAMFL